MTFTTNGSIIGLLHIRVDGEPDVIRWQTYADRKDWKYNLDVYNLQRLGDALHYEVHNFSVEEGEW